MADYCMEAWFLPLNKTFFINCLSHNSVIFLAILTFFLRIGRYKLPILIIINSDLFVFSELSDLNSQFRVMNSEL